MDTRNPQRGMQRGTTDETQIGLLPKSVFVCLDLWFLLHSCSFVVEAPVSLVAVLFVRGT